MTTEQSPEITLYRFAPTTPCFDSSPFVNKLETIFRMTSIPYTLAQGDSRKAPKGKLPFISLPSGERIGDSSLCYAYLKEHKGIPDIDSSLTELEHANAIAYKAWLEEWVYYLMVWERWVDNWYITREKFLKSAIPIWPLRVVVFNLIYRNVAGTLYGKGLTRHSRDEIVGFITEAAKTMSVLVGEKGLIKGKECSVNAFLIGFLIAVFEFPDLCPVLCGEISKYPNLMSYRETMAEKYFPDRKLKEKK